MREMAPGKPLSLTERGRPLSARRVDPLLNSQREAVTEGPRFGFLRLACSVGSVCFVWDSCQAMGHAYKYPVSSYQPDCPGSAGLVTQRTPN